MRPIGVAAVSALLLAVDIATGATIRVPGDVPTVLAAVDLAVPGDSVLIDAGTWTERATRVVVAENGPHQFSACAFARGGVTIRGEGAGVTVLDVGGYAGTFVSDVVLVQRPGEGPLRLEGLTLTGASGVGDAVVGLYSDGLEIRSCHFEGNRIAVEAGNCPLTMTDCEVIGNSAPDYGAIVLASLTPIHLTRCRFEGNTGRCVQTNYDPGDGPAIFQDCEFVRNRGPDFGVALNLQYAGSFLIERCLFLQNVAETGTGGAVRVAAGAGEIRHSVFAYDSCYTPGSRGAGIRMESSQVSVYSNTFVGCYSGLAGSAFSAFESTVTAFRGNVIAHSSRGAGVNGTSTVVALNACNLYWGNTADFGNWTPAPSDVFADPLFCDLPALDFTVRDDSPCLFPPTPSCAPIGALGVACGGVAIEPASFGRIKSMFRE